jgi:predicted HNH restriction endonuclease
MRHDEKDDIARFVPEIDRETALRAIREYDELGPEKALEKYRAGTPKSYVLIHNGRQYPAKGIACIAIKILRPELMKEWKFQFVGGGRKALNHLKTLGLDRVTRRIEEEKLRKRLYSEGKEVMRETRFFARNYALAQTCKVKAKYTCAACGYKPSALLGDRGKRSIEAHHVDPIAMRRVDDRRNGREATEQDIAVLCANCHRLVHADDPVLTVTALRAILGR